MTKHIAKDQIFRLDYSNLFSPQVSTMVALVDFDMAFVMEEFIIQQSERRMFGDEVSHYSILTITLPKDTDRETIINTYRHMYVDLIHKDFPSFLIQQGYAKNLEVLSIRSISDIM